MREFLNVGKSVEKIDSLALATGEEKFTEDFRIENPLEIASLYSPHAHAKILNIDTTSAEKVAGVVDILHYKNTARILHTTAGQGFPEPSPYDTAVFNDIMRFVGDRVAIVAAETLEAAREAVSKIKVEYEILEPLFDIEKADLKGAPRIHDQDEYPPIPVVYRPEQNIAAETIIGFGDLEKGFKESDFIEEHDYRIHYASHCAIEPHSAFATFDERGRLVIISPTQVPFHARRIVAHILQIPVGMIRVIKPRIGGGFGGKQEVMLEQLVALVAWRNKRSAHYLMSRSEVFISARTRHPMRTRIKMGFKKDGEITAIEMNSRMNAGGYGSHALTVLSNAGSKVLPLFNKVENIKFIGQSVYTNMPVGGAYRGYGATQGYFAFCQQLDMISRKTNQDLIEFIKKWHIKEGETSGIFEVLGEGKEGVSQIIRSCKLSECIDRGAKEIGWYEKRGKKIRNGDRIKGMGLAVAMQGSGIPRVDMASAWMKMNEDGSFNLHIGATDIGTGSDTILAQIAAETLQVPTNKMIVRSSDTDLTPFDVGAYASSTTYISGNAVRLCAEKIRDIIIGVAAEMLDTPKENCEPGFAKIIDLVSKKKVTFEEICIYSLYTNNQFQIQADASYFGTESPAPFFAQFAEVDVDLRTGKVYPIKLVSAIDCGQAINPVLVEGQVEGAALNGLSYALCEEYIFDSKGRMTNDSFWDYKIYVAPDIPEMKTIIASSYEKTGPFGAKSAGEIAINGPCPAVANAIFDAVGVRMFETPFTPERVFKRMKEEGIV